MTKITYTDPDGGAKEHPDVVKFIADYHRTEEPDAKIHVFANRKFNPMDPLEWSMVITSVRGRRRRHIEVYQRGSGGIHTIKFNID